jgi:hypothetical protein
MSMNLVAEKIASKLSGAQGHCLQVFRSFIQICDAVISQYSRELDLHQSNS